MRLVWYFFFSPLLSGRVKEPCQPLFLCFSQNSYGMAVTKKGKEPTDSSLTQTSAALRQNGLAPKSVSEQVKAAVGEVAKTNSVKVAIDDNNQGLLYKNPSISDARFSDMFRGSEVGNFAQMDLAKVQMFFFTLLVGVAYAYALAGLLSSQDVIGDSVSMPQLTDGMVGLLAISNGSYLGSKAVVHTPSPSEA